jgi:hypothetical protein
VEFVKLTGRHSDPTVIRISSAPVPHSQDLNRRMGHYVLTMAVRTACVVVAVVADGALRWVAIVGAVVLPWLAVLAANAGRLPEHGPAGSGVAELPAWSPPPAPLPPGVAERVWPSRYGPSASRPVPETPHAVAPAPGIEDRDARPGSGRGPRVVEGVVILPDPADAPPPR